MRVDEEIAGEAHELRDRNGAAEYDYALSEDEEDERQAGDADGIGGNLSSPPPPRRRRLRRRLSASTTASFQLYTPNEEQAVVSKFDRRLVLFLALCYMLSFLDRSNIGNARIAGMEEDLQTKPPRSDWYEWALAAFYISYIVFEWMSLLFKLVPAHVLISIIILSWGITASLQAITTSYPGLIFLRALLGIGEAGFTGVPFYLSFFFKRNELAFRTAIFISAAPLATTFASTLAWVILRLGQASPIAPWRLLFLIEGFPSILIAAVAWSVIPDHPQSASYLTARERQVARLRLRRGKRQPGSKESGASTKETLKYRDVLSVFLDPKAWITAVMFFLTNMAYSSLPVFLPLILREMDHTTLESQALSAPPYLIAFITVLVTAHLSDKRQSRTWFVVFHALLSLTGYTMLALARPLALSNMWRYIAIYPAAVGFFNVVVLTIAWNINNQPSESKQGGGFVLFQVIGQCGPLVGTRLYPMSDAPFFQTGMWACAGAMLGVTLLALCLRLLLGRLNRKLERESREFDGEEGQGLVGESESRGTGREERGFRYML